jgi:hypothetical protein
MASIHEATQAARTCMTLHLLELEFVSHEAATLAQSVGGLAESFPMPSMAPAKQSQPKEHACDRCHQPVEPFTACPCTQPTNADILALHRDIDHGIAKPHTSTAEERSAKLDAELAAAQADLDRLPSSIAVSGLNAPHNLAALARLDDAWAAEEATTNGHARKQTKRRKK